MKKFIYIFSLLPLSFNLWAGTTNMYQTQSIYGIDDRVDVYNSSIPKYREWAKSVAALIPDYWLTEVRDGSGDLKFDGMPSPLNLCSNQRFIGQIAISECSAFLVGEDLILTAGHCVEMISNSCEWYYWIFDFVINQDGSNPSRFSRQQIYRCKEVVADSMGPLDYMDYALIRLDRKVEGRAALPLRKSGIIPDNATVVAVGTPSGLPTKIAEHGEIINNLNEIYFTTTLDTFTGNSGSPVINAESGEVEGMLVSGLFDYKYNYEKKCYETIEYQVPYCRGETALRISAIVDGLARIGHRDLIFP
ncbi:MAG: hypothetical protein A2504_00955 [Bdellovibrionales bacterium RIFOXYD12_FULL_39_22]|nr:MAG: hypothetical protein A2385_03575 [Bdellovibrionales bacterium RIFOXYB1_FULL_39_21]OFZ42592.1 MAG: hypothetical protein A2485_09730 [Bdellovibrionales bacterium RIFOXYC12_FULL_39_17]OFZ47140.1 MAG: hypothetical protein A2404_15565 [Bdellovibrionales bacterium RIFOXYC1_FULL_39_130]OFZ74756.1 MAG: hypothetical protein A2451_08195 [Bdellovibrionales bacterium RIFOXYC2_FULL_39_8]OFZ75388.1 MAG: hypothetical protein A2560_14340 [Bdellovibrionales bacterium RIFOXYD1_FULL_39_84]OFZ93339.1 MAG: